MGTVVKKNSTHSFTMRTLLTKIKEGQLHKSLCLGNLHVDLETDFELH